ncbi:hypothetical protein FPV67DRAFT_773845 [Lyophyllum atratum]|nr:hypothetical protein FPV67DRAFT_773845 [Lyophyllum atratum]
MSLAAARQTLSSTARASLRRPTASTFRAGARRMNSSHAGPKTRSDKPWIIGSALVFGPAFLYLASPSARKTTQFAHNDAHDFPGHDPDPKAVARAQAPAPVAAAGLKETAPETPRGVKPPPVAASTSTSDKQPEPVIMKDDEGTEEDVTESLQAEEAADVPKADGAEPSGAEPVPKVPVTRDEPSPESEHGKQKRGTFADADDPTVATEQGKARKAAKEGIPPKKAAESSKKEESSS